MVRETKKKGREPIKGFQVLENECIWMKAGVINFRICDMVYDCYNCPFNKGMVRAMGKDLKKEVNQMTAGWAQELQKKYRGNSRPCRHYLTGRVNAPKICTLNYECYHCAYDQMLDDADLYEVRDRPQIDLASGYKLAKDYYYHYGHTWVRFEHGGMVRVGLDDFAVSLFGVVNRLSLPALGSSLKQGLVSWTFQRDENEAAVLSPLSGQVLAVNYEIQDQPEIMHQDPYHWGWLFVLEPKWPKKSIKSLYFGSEGRRWMELEGQRLLELMGPEYRKLAATGGTPVRDVVSAVRELEWNTLTREFLHTEPV